ncbi:MAG: alpha-galactosidase, partial [Oscillospiraceae bacterium]|nr:alpha-galactosidase [Oscillospiraceae bacterium]
MALRFIIHEDGSYDILGSAVSLLSCYPRVNGKALRPTGVQTSENGVVYSLPGAEVRLRLHADAEGRIGLDFSARGLAGIHDAEPLGAAAVEGAGRMYVQGLGMEGPSGTYGITETAPASYGLAALYTDEGVLLAYAEDHRRYTAVFRLEQSAGMAGERSAFSGGFNLEGTAKGTLTLPTLFFGEAENLTAGLRQSAERIAAAMDARRKMPPAFFWSGWYYAYETLDQSGLEEVLRDIRGRELPFQYIELDAGYTPHLGDWLTPNHRWPGGLKRAAETILSAGFRPGIWVAPFIVGDGSALYREHPDWVLHDLDGNPVVQLRSYTEPKIWGNPDCDYYILDASHPGALAWLKTVFETLRSWGFAFFKTDFMLWNMRDSATVRRYDPNVRSVEVMRSVLRTVREVIGGDSYLLGCIAPFMPFIGYADGMRLAGDCGAQWAETYGPVNMLRELPCDSYFNHVFWQNDPDAMLLRDFHSHLSAEEVRSLALLQALSGGAVSTSDPVERLGEDRMKLLRFVQPREKVTPSFPFFGEKRKELLLCHRLRQGNLLFVLNPTDEPLTVACRLRELFG